MGHWANLKWDTLAVYTQRDANIQVECRCGRKIVMDAKRLARWFDIHAWGNQMHDLARHMKCINCGKGPSWFRPTISPPTDPTWMANEADRKRLYRKMREKRVRRD